MTLSIIVIAIEVAFIILLLTGLSRHAAWIKVLMRVFALFLVLLIYSKPGTSSTKMPWIMLILLAPILGAGLYLIVGLNSSTKVMRRRYRQVDDALLPRLKTDRTDAAQKALAAESERWSTLSDYITTHSGYPLYDNTASSARISSSAWRRTASSAGYSIRSCRA